MEMLEPLRRETSPFDVGTPRGAGTTGSSRGWCARCASPSGRGTVGCAIRSSSGSATDEQPEDCRRELRSSRDWRRDGRADARGEPAPDERRRRGRRPPDRTRRGVRQIREVTAHESRRRSSGRREGYTKGDLIGYYERSRRCSCPISATGPSCSRAIPTASPASRSSRRTRRCSRPIGSAPRRIYSSGHGDRDIRYFVVDDVESLRYVANMGTIPLHVWSARVADARAAGLARPRSRSQGGAVHPRGAGGAHAQRDPRELELPSYVKTSGATGLHILMPMGQRYTHEEVRRSRDCSRCWPWSGAGDLDRDATIKARGGKVYVDFGQNGTATRSSAPYSVRPLPGAPGLVPAALGRGHARGSIPRASPFAPCHGASRGGATPAAGPRGRASTWRLHSRESRGGSTEPLHAAGALARRARGPERPTPPRAMDPRAIRERSSVGEARL